MNSRDYISQSLKTIIEMLHDRNIKTGLTPDGVNELIGSNLNYFDFTIDKIRIIYYLPSKFKWADLKKSFEDEIKSDLYILVVKEKLTQNNIKFIHSMKLPIQIFEIRDLQFNISTHKLVPKHELITDQSEVDDIIKRYSLKTKFQLPIIFKTEPMGKYLNLKNGDVIKITRVSPTAGEYIVYRCCL
jgi:DNA-directed RNA polymerase subunit H (RpoH/RPB5)